MKIYNKEKWEKVRLGEIFELQMGKTPSRNKENYWRHGENSWISISDMKNEEKYICDTKEKITDLAVEESKIKVIPKDTVIMSFKLSIGKLAITSKDMFTNEAIMAFFPKDKVEIDNNYLFYSLKKVNWTEGTNKAVKGLTLNKPLIASKEILLPSIQIQKEIAKRLDIVMEILKAKRKILLQLDELSKCLFIKMFGDPILNEKKWRKKQLQEECEIITGNTPSRKEKNYYGNYIEWIKSDNIVPFNIYPTKAKEFLSENGVKRGRKIEKNNILMTCIAGSVNSIGNISITDRDVSFNQQINGIRVQENNVWFMFKQFELSKKYIQSSITMSLKGILSKSKLSELYFIFPPIELQNQFAERVKMIEKSKFEIQKSIEETQKLFDSLMKKYFG